MEVDVVKKKKKKKKKNIYIYIYIYRGWYSGTVTARSQM